MNDNNDTRHCNIGPLLDNWLSENVKKILKPWKGVLCFHFRVCLSLCLSPSYRGHLLTKEPNFWTEGSLGHEKETCVFCFSKFWEFTSLGSFFRVFSLYYLIISAFARGHIIGITAYSIDTSLLIIWDWNGWCSLTDFFFVGSNIETFFSEC